ncbi:MAG: septal ring lytic transglycosylase RlpA family protein [Chlorobi bacterium]|nr:septal ring lytic transglycosylase RlpA family protein [Chlorobiota bacterium]
MIFLSGFLLLYSCGSAPKFTVDKEKTTRENESAYDGRYSAEESEKEATSEDILELRDVAPAAVEIGTASYYGKDFDGKITYNGEVYNMYGISAAHPSYPMGTLIRVTNLANSKSIELIINDRMPYRPDRIIDLSYGTAEELDFLADGLAEVKIEVLQWGKGRK